MSANVATEAPVLREALAWAETVLPHGTVVQDLSNPMADYTLEFQFVTEFNPRIAPLLAEHSAFVRTKGMWNARLSTGDSWEEVRRAISEHFSELSYVYGDDSR